MPKFKYETEVEAPIEDEADSKMESAMILLARLSTKELKKLAHIVQNDPVKTALAKKALGV